MVKFTKRTIFKIAYPFALVYWYVVRPQTERAKVILIHNDQILLVRQTFHLKQWTLPGGGINKNEPPLEAAKRELREELGLTDLELIFLGLSDGRIDNRRDLTYVFTGCLTEGHLAHLQVDHIEIAEAQLFKWDNLPYLKPANKDIIKLYDRFPNN